ncbi:MAG: 3-hydroxyacyl-CoA dehydrogenase, partial [bacterium]
HQMTLGGGCEICLGCDRVQPAAETYIGLVEVGVGLIPAGGGCKELCLRAVENIPHDVEVGTLRFIGRAFETIAAAKVSTSAQEAVDMGILRAHDRSSPNHDHRIADAKNLVLGMLKAGYAPPRERRDIRVPGRAGVAALSNIAWTLQQGNYATEYDLYLARKVAYVLCGGDVPEGTLVSEQRLLDLEREAFVHLCGQEKTLARIQHMLTKKKPLRN